MSRTVLFERLWSEALPWLRQLLRQKHCRGLPSWVEDIEQLVALYAWRSFDRFELQPDQDENDQFRGWIYGISRRAAVLVWRREVANKRMRLLRSGALPLDELLLPGVDQDPASRLIEEEELQELQELLQQQPERDRKLLQQQAAGLSYAEQAEIFAVPVTTITNWLHRAKRELAQQLGRQGT